MRKATFFIAIATVISSSTWGGSAERAASDTMAMNTTASNPLIHLPGMNSSDKIGASVGKSVQAGALPLPQVSEFMNAPNPFDSRKESTSIGYLLASDSKVTLTIYDLLGMKVIAWDFVAGQNGGKAGANQIVWNGTNESGRKVSKGGYIAELEIDSPQGSTTAIRKIGVIH